MKKNLGSPDATVVAPQTLSGLSGVAVVAERYDYADGYSSNVLYPDRARECAKCEAIYYGMRCGSESCTPKPMRAEQPNRELSDLFALVMSTGRMQP